MPEDTELQYLDELESELRETQSKNRQLSQAQASLFGMNTDENLIKWQLDLREDLDRIYHLLNGHVIKEDEKGNQYYAEPDDTNLKPFNDYGVQSIMNIMSFYLNRNTILSNYTAEQIDWKVYDFGKVLIDFIFNNYEMMGMDTPDKRKMYPVIVQELVDSVHSAYLRAMGGKERESLRTARTVTQSEPLGQRSQIPMVSQPKPRSILNPLSWFR